MEKNLARLISILSNPILFFVASLLILCSLNNSLVNIGPASFFIIAGMLFPTIVYVYEILKHKKHFWHYVSIGRSNRNLIFLTSLFSFIILGALYSSWNLRFWEYLSILMVIIFASVYLVNRYLDKASVHALVYVFSTMLLVNFGGRAFGILFLFLPLVYWSRITLHKHTWLQLLMGTAIGMFVGLLAWTI